VEHVSLVSSFGPTALVIALPPKGRLRSCTVGVEGGAV